MTPDSEGLYPIANTHQSGLQADIVFVHGLAGGSHSTWRYGNEGEKNHFFWPEALGKHLPTCAIWSLGYAAGLTHWFSEEGLAIDDRAANLALKLSSQEDAEFGSRPLIFIAHSMGGLVVKEFVTGALSLGGQDWNVVAKGVRGIVFLGTPHHGSHMASIAKRFAVLLRTQEHVKQMKFAGRTLDKLHLAFVKWQSQSQCPIESYVETRGIARSGWLGRFLPRVLVVPRVSSNPMLGNCACHPIPADHITLVKPSGPEDTVYTGVLNFIRKALKPAAPSAAHTPAAPPAAQGPTPTPTPPPASTPPIQPPVVSAHSPQWPQHLIKPGAITTAQSFVGRTSELDQIRHALDARQSVICVIGMAGQGKSSLLGEWHKQHGNTLNSKALFWCRPYEAGYTYARFLPDIIEYLTDGQANLQKMPSTSQQTEFLCILLRQRPTVVVLDGAERWLRRWVNDPDAVAEGATVDDRRGADENLDLLLSDAATWQNGSVLVMTSRALPSAIEDRPHATIGTSGSAASKFLGGLEANAAVELLKTLGVHGRDDELLAAANDYNCHPFALTILGHLLSKEYGGRAAAHSEVDPVRGDPSGKLHRLLDKVVQHHLDAVELLRLAACCLGPVPVVLLSELLKRDAAQMRHQLANLADWQLISFNGDEVNLHSLMRRFLRSLMDANERIVLLEKIALWFAARPMPPHTQKLEQMSQRIRAIEHILEAGNPELAAELLYTKPTAGSHYIFVEWLDVFGFMGVHVELAGRLIGVFQDLIREKGRSELRNDLASAYNNRGNALSDQGKLAEAIADYGRAIEIRETLVEREGRSELRNDLASAYNNRGNALRNQGKLAEAIADYGRAIEIYQTLVEREGRSELIGDLEIALFNRGMGYMRLKQWTDARRDIERGGNLLRQAIAEGRRNLLPSFLQTVAASCAIMEKLDNISLVASWANDALRWVVEAAERGKVAPILHKVAIAFLNALKEKTDPLRKAGLDFEMLKRAATLFGVNL